MSALKHFDLHVPISEDGRTTFAEVADILDHLATVYAWHPIVAATLDTMAVQAREFDEIYEEGLDLEQMHSHVSECGMASCSLCNLTPS